MERIVCSWCQAQNEPGTSTCVRCGAPLDASAVVTDSGWREAPRIKDLTEIRFGASVCQLSGALVPVVDMTLGQGDGLFFEPKVLLWKDDQVDLGAMKLSGGAKRVVSGMPYMVATVDGPGRIAFSRDAAGEVVVLPMDPATEIDARGHSFLAASRTISYSFVALKGYKNIVHGGGLYLDRFATGDQPGVLLLHGYGNVLERTLAEGETIYVEPGGFLYKDASVTMQVEQEKIKTAPGRHGLYLAEMTGPGRVGIQSMEA